MGCFSDVFVVVFRVKLGESALQAAKETQATGYVTSLITIQNYYYYMLSIYGLFLDGLQGPDGHPGDVGERGPPGSDGDKVDGRSCCKNNTIKKSIICSRGDESLLNCL